MPVYEYHCDKCDHEVTLMLSISEREQGALKCPTCGGKALRPLLSACPRRHHGTHRLVEPDEAGRIALAQQDQA